MIINLKSQTDLSGFYIIFEGSTNLETRGTYGISHLMEHLLCKNFEHLRDDFEREGIDWNAYTSTNEVVFFFTGLDKYIVNRKMELVDLMTDFNISKEQFENERKIILQEYNNTFSDQSECHMLNLGRKLFKSYGAIGLREDLESLKYMDCLNFFEKQFKSPVKIINVSNKNQFKMDIDFDSQSQNIKYEFGPYRDVILEPTRNFGDKVSVAMVSKLVDVDFAYISFINNMLSSGLSSPLYSEVREKRGLVYQIRCGQTRINRQGLTVISTETSGKKAEQVLEAIKFVLDNPNKFMTKKRFDLVRNSYRIKLEKDRINRYQNVNLWINPPGWSIKEVINTITYEKVMEVYERNFKYDDFYVSIDKTEFT